MQLCEENHLWCLAAAFYHVMSKSSRASDVIRLLARIDYLDIKDKIPSNDTIHRLHNYGLSATGGSGRIIYVDHKWTYRQGSKLLRGNSLVLFRNGSDKQVVPRPLSLVRGSSFSLLDKGLFSKVEAEETTLDEKCDITCDILLQEIVSTFIIYECFIELDTAWLTSQNDPEYDALLTERRACESRVVPPQESELLEELLDTICDLNDDDKTLNTVPSKSTTYTTSMSTHSHSRSDSTPTAPVSEAIAPAPPSTAEASRPPTIPALRMIPLRRPSWMSQQQSTEISNLDDYSIRSPSTSKRKRRINKRPSMTIRLALSESAPFQQLLREGVVVVLHFCPAGERRPRRVRRLLELIDGNERGSGNNVSSITVDSPVLRFSRIESNGIVLTNDFVQIVDISDIIMGAHTRVFVNSLTQMHGDGITYDKTTHSKRCFTILGPVSPFDSRPCLDIEIFPLDKQKHDEMNAANLVALGVSTALQIISNYENNTTDLRMSGISDTHSLSQNERGDERQIESLESPRGMNGFPKNHFGSVILPTTKALSPEMMSLFNGPIPSEKFAINHIMQEVVDTWASTSPPDDDRVEMKEVV